MGNGYTAKRTNRKKNANKRLTFETLLFGTNSIAFAERLDFEACEAETFFFQLSQNLWQNNRK